MRTSRLVLAQLSILFLVLLGLVVNAQHLVAARVLSFEGPVDIQRRSSPGVSLKAINFKRSDELKPGDRILTGWGGRLVLGLTDGSQAVIAERSVIEVKDLGNSPRELFQVLKGKTRIYVEKLGGRPNPYRINTPTAVIAVRGTLFDVLVKSNETEVFVHEGQVAVSSLQSPDQLVLLSPGQMTRVRLDQTPTSPAPFRRGRNDDSFRREAERRPVADLFDFREDRLGGRTADQPTIRPVQRDTNTAVRPTSGQRANTVRP